MSTGETQTGSNKAENSNSSNHKIFTHTQVQNEDHDIIHENSEHESNMLNRSPYENGSPAGSSNVDSSASLRSDSHSFEGMPYLQRREYIAHLQRTIGNDAVGYLWRTGKLQKRLKIDPEKTPGYAGPSGQKVQRAKKVEEEMPQIQHKLSIGPANDPYEQEADRVADRVVSMSDAPLQRVSGSGSEEKENLIQAMPLADPITPIQRSKKSE